MSPTRAEVWADAFSVLHARALTEADARRLMLNYLRDRYRESVVWRGIEPNRMRLVEEIPGQQWREESFNV